MLNTQAICETISAVIVDVNKDDGKLAFQNPYDAGKGTVLLETRMFNETPLNPHKCFDTLTKILHLLVTKGETLTPAEESNLFFAVTKLFQSQNDRLRRMFYLAIKTLNIREGEAFIVTSSLTKDMNSGSDVHRANAIRVLSKIVDASMATQIERYLKTAIVDKSPFVACAALVCGLRLLKMCPELVRRWVNEVTESVRSKNVMVQFHALTLLYELKKKDRLALHKVVGTLTASPLKSPLAECSLIRYATQILRTERDVTLEKSIVEYLENRLRHRSEMIVLEATRAICTLASEGSSIDLSPTLTALQILLASQRPVVRFSAIRTFNQLAQTHAQVVSQCNSDIESALSDTNRTIATLALTTLLKTGGESGVDRLLKQISVLMADIGDTFRMDIIKAVRQLASTYVSKHRPILTFLADQLREEASFNVKSDLVDAIAFLMQDNAQALETGLLHLCEFIEDCEYPPLCVKVLSLLGELAPSTSCVSKYIRFIYNRLILEASAVRAAAVHALTTVGHRCPQLRKDISALLESCLVDNDDEIRERAHLYFKALRKSSDSDDVSTVDSATLSLDTVLQPALPVSLDALLEFAQEAIERSASGTTPGPLSLADLPTEEEYRKAKQQADGTPTPTGELSEGLKAAAAKALDSEASNRESELAAILQTIAPTVSPGYFDHTTKPVFLTEKEVEYPVQCVKHIFRSEYLLVEFQITNTMPDQTLTEIQVVPACGSAEGSGWTIVGSSQVDLLPFDTTASTYTLLKASTDTPLLVKDGLAMPVAPATFSVTMKFMIRETDDEFGYDDSYPLEPLTISVGDYVISKSLRAGQFKPQWAALGDSGEVVVKLSLSYRTLDVAVPALIDLLNLAPCDGTEHVDDGKVAQDLFLSGTFTGGSPILCRCMLVLSPEHGCLLKIMFRAKTKHISETMLTLFD